MSIEIKKGQQYRTPFEPSGIVEVLEIEPADQFLKRESCLVKFIGDHPKGYKDGSIGRYFRDELKAK